ncbi:carboxylesterase/lipase family protein [Mycobacteroides abscessus]|uniref:carboxylesterase/lipase family protein n=1 Tax=Mycobacteroides abscessus TaxID=36809 RepID=UPI0005E4A0AA|nr:carboxylesterase/lipase family protein [Mycobacteroides abscessus]CPW76162.1 Probable carboxylesterase (LipT) [Mycobacteroides abscessus]SKF60745.1 Probable carboxylesterase (LipT) [Mycobacteroides abscessus subsp. bolletii]SKH71896.1 Probable carboxylesterase (LipT) [Mycobacteroides abscessus subsp. bolletii]
MGKGPSSAVRVRTTNGVVEGFLDGDVRRFRAIPYAEPPVGALRLRSPEPAQPWAGVLACDSWKSASPQKRVYVPLSLNNFQEVGEDCLTLNVTVPAANSSDPLAVMFYIHGGAYVLGSSALALYDGADLARRGCVFVSVNYRVGAYGAMDLSSLSDARHTIDSNLYLRDLVLALQWVRENIAAFGGDPGSVTIFGESAGAHCVQMLLAVPAAAGLFHRAICQSTASGMIHTRDEAAANARRLVEYLGADARSPAEAVFNARPRALVSATHRLLTAKTRESAFSLGVGPSIDGDVVPGDPIAMMEHGEAHRVPLIIGYNAEEIRLFNRLLTRAMSLSRFDTRAVARALVQLRPEHAQRVIDCYQGYPSRDALVRLMGDAMFGSEAWRVAQAHSRHSSVYFYRYDYAPRPLRRFGLGAAHATELFAVFGLFKRWPALAGKKDRRHALALTEDIQSRWLAFSRTGVPGTGWPAYGEPERAVMVFDQERRIELDPHCVQRELWRDIGRVA